MKFLLKKNIVIILFLSISFFSCQESQTTQKETSKDLEKVQSSTSQEDTSPKEVSGTEVIQSTTEENSTKENIAKSDSKEIESTPSINIKAHQKISSPIALEVNSQGIWFGSEGELGIIMLLDKDGKKLGQCILSTKENWMSKGPVPYNCEFSYKAQKSGQGKLLVQKHNPSGMKKHDKSFEIPVVYSKTE